MGDRDEVKKLEGEVARLRLRVASLETGVVAVDPAVIAVAQSSPDNIMLLDTEGRIQFINWTVPDLSPEQVLGTEVFRYTTPESHPSIRRCLARVIATGKPDSYETWYLSNAGEISLWESRVAPVVRGGVVVGFVSNSRNVTDQRAAETEQRRFFNMSRDLLCVVGTTHFKRINPAFERTLGHGEAELLERPFLDFVHLEDVERSRETMRQLVDGQEIIDFEIRMRRKDGAFRCVSWRATSEARGGVIYAVGRDVTDHRVLETQLRQSQKMDAVGQLAGGVAHDFNNLLMAIRANAGFALVAPSERKRAECLEDIKRAADRAAALTRQLLTFSRLQPTERRSLDLNALVRDLIKLLRRLIHESIAIDLVADTEVPVVVGDPGQIEQVLLNLCVNARDAMPGAGRITIQVESVVLGESFPGRQPWVSPGRFVLLTVTDTGTGMTRDVQDRAFEPFFTTKEPGHGTGLGLATVYGIVRQHSGLVQLASEPGKGTTVRIYFPVGSPAAAEVEAEPDEEIRGGHETLLVAEDEDVVRRVVVEILVQAGYRVLVAADGVEAVNLFRANAGTIRLVLLDVVMPRLSGPEAGAQIRALNREVAVIFSSGYGDLSGGGDPALAGAAYLPKPYEPDALLRQVRRILDGR